MTGEEKEQIIIDYFKQIFPDKKITRDTRVNANQNVRIRDIAYSTDQAAYERITAWAKKRLAAPIKNVVVVEQPVSRSKELEELLIHYRPTFGSTKTLTLLDKIGKYRKLKDHVDSLTKKRGMLEKTINNQTSSQKDLSKLEAMLLNDLKEAAQERYAQAGL